VQLQAWGGGVLEPKRPRAMLVVVDERVGWAVVRVRRRRRA